MNAARLLNSFLEMVQIDSPSRFEAKMAVHCEKRLEQLGFSVEYDDATNATGSDTGNLIAKLPGTAKGQVILSAHMDCVDPCRAVIPTVEEGIIRSVGNTVLGSDDKAGIAAIFEAVTSVLEAQDLRPDITVLLTTCEELSLLGSGALSENLFVDGAPCLVFDADGKPGTIIVGAPFHHTLKAEFSGKAAHAGVEPEKGHSAIQMAAAAISAMELGRIDECTTANIGVIEGGHEVNIVSETCVIRGECRSLHEDRANERKAQMTKACKQAAEQFDGHVQMQWTQDYPGILYDENDPLVQALVEAARAANLEPILATSGGGSDANIMRGKGAKAITLSTGMTNFHSSEEYILVKDLEDTTRFCEFAIRQFAE